MEIKNDRIRAYRPVSPGELLKDELEARDITAEDFAVSMGMSVSELDKLLKGKRCLDITLAKKIEKLLGIEAPFWLRAQTNYEDDLAYYAKKKAKAKKLSLWRKLPWNKVAF